MRRFISIGIIVAALGGAAYAYMSTRTPCATPMTYRIGSIDQRFNMSDKDVRRALADAEALWEDAVGKNLFVYEPATGDIVVHFIYDERQRETLEAERLEAILSEKEGLTEELRAEYDARVAEYESRKARYDAVRAEYEAALAAHNDEVAKWNKRGGAPKDVYAKLTAERDRLREQEAQIDALAGEINSLVNTINHIGEQSDAGIRDYNQVVEEFNERFGESREFTQGDYQYPNAIHVYQYRDGMELRAVLAHEFGHALSLGHVENRYSIMYPLMEGQHTTLALSEEDVAEFRAVCGAGN